jgi:hypothetical protein
MTHEFKDCADVESCNTHSAIAMFKRTEEMQAEIMVTLQFIKETLVKADTTIATVAEQVMPTVNELLASPMLKMLGIGKKTK